MQNDYLYAENILEHYRNPKNKIKNEKQLCDCVGYGENIDCGDSGELYVNVEDNNIIKVFWKGDGCALSQAGLSMLTEKINREKVSLEEVRLWSPSAIYELLGVKISPGRVNCALLSYKCLENALKKIK